MKNTKDDSIRLRGLRRDKSVVPTLTTSVAASGFTPGPDPGDGSHHVWVRRDYCLVPAGALVFISGTLLIAGEFVFTSGTLPVAGALVIEVVAPLSTFAPELVDAAPVELSVVF